MFGPNLQRTQPKFEYAMYRRILEKIKQLAICGAKHTQKKLQQTNMPKNLTEKDVEREMTFFFYVPSSPCCFTNQNITNSIFCHLKAPSFTCILMWYTTKLNLFDLLVSSFRRTLDELQNINHFCHFRSI